MRLDAIHLIMFVVRLFMKKKEKEKKRKLNYELQVGNTSRSHKQTSLPGNFNHLIIPMRVSQRCIKMIHVCALLPLGLEGNRVMQQILD